MRVHVEACNPKSLPQSLSPPMFRDRLSLSLDLTALARLADQQAPVILLSLLS